MKPKVIRRPSQRKPLSNLGGPIQTSGDSKIASILAAAWKVAEAHNRPELTHTFHSYAGRLPWALARYLIENLPAPYSEWPSAVLDPFVGSGTVALEAFIHGVPSTGIDLNPLSPMLGRVKTRLTTQQERESFLDQMKDVTLRSLARVQKRVMIRAKLKPEHIELYDPHVLKEMAGLLAEIDTIKDAYDRESARMVFSSIAIKFSRLQAETASEPTEKRIRKGLTSEFFLRRAHELASQWKALAHIRLTKPIFPKFKVADAKRLHQAAKGPFDLILTSPPYGGTYNYVQHHALRCDWLGFDTRAFRRAEIASRRQGIAQDAENQWRNDMQQVLAECAAVTRAGAWMAWVVGDAVFNRSTLPTLLSLRELGDAQGFRWAAVASQERKDWQRAHTTRYEHLIAWQRT